MTVRFTAPDEGTHMRVLLVEDTERLRELTAAALRKSGFAVDAFGTIGEAEQALDMVAYDGVLLDIGLPDGNGMSFLAALRRDGRSVPVMLLTARDDVASVVDGLNVGADDYLRKPFEMEELIARVRALVRRPGAAFQPVLALGNLLLDCRELRVKVAGVAIGLSRREASALEVLVRNAGRVISKSVLEDALYGFDDGVSSNAVEVLVHRIRKKLMQAGARPEIQTLRGIGYLIEDVRS